MCGYEPARIAVVAVPARADIAAVAKICRVEAKAGNHGKGVAVTGINREPAAVSPFAVTHQVARG